MSVGISSSQSSLRNHNLRSFSNFALTETGAQRDKGLNILPARASYISLRKYVLDCSICNAYDIQDRIVIIP